MDATESVDLRSEEQGKRPTSELILAAAFRILAREGYASLTARRVAQEAGTNLALVNYYFGGKKGLLLALYDQLERDRFERQSALYQDDGEPLSSKWRRAVEYYRQDLHDGFVRVHHELQAQGFGDEKLAGRARDRVTNWAEMLTAAATRYLPELGVTTPARDLVLVLNAFWYGMEQQHLIEVPEEDMAYFDLLERVGRWLEERERAIGSAASRVAERDSASAAAERDADPSEATGPRPGGPRAGP